MAMITIFDRGNLKELDTTGKSLPEPQPGLVASFSRPTSALIGGILLAILGVVCTLFLFARGVSTWQRVLFLVCGPPFILGGAALVRRARRASGLTAREHRYFYYDDEQIVMGKTKPIWTDIEDSGEGPEEPSSLLDLH
jgi:hypothetical protein